MTADPHDRLRAAYASMVQAGRPADRARCASPEALLETVERAGTEEDRLRVLDHVMSCAACREEFDLLRTSAQAAVAAGGSAHWSHRPAVRFLAVAASLVMVAGLGTYFRRMETQSASVLRGSQSFTLHPARRLQAGGTALSWRPVPGRVRYDLAVIDDAGRSVVETRLADTLYVLADSLGAGRTMVWSVAVVMPDGSTLGPLSAPVTPPRR
jgi:hypothetical protein